MEKSDGELVTEYLAGNEEAFTSLVKRHLKSVYSFAARSTETEAEDITQDTFLKAWKNIKTYDPRRAAFKTWLMRIARNVVIDSLRKRKSFIFSDLESAESEDSFLNVPDPAILPDESIARAHDARAVENALYKLSLPYREVLLLHYMNHLTFEEIGDVLSEPLNTVKSRHRRGIMELRRQLEDLHQKGP